MNKTDAKRIAENISIDSLELMLKNAKEGIKDWSKRSNINKSLDRGAAWNILAKCIAPLKNGEMRRTESIIKTNLIREYGEFLPKELRSKPRKPPLPDPYHQKPDMSII